MHFIVDVRGIFQLQNIYLLFDKQAMLLNVLENFD